MTSTTFPTIKEAKDLLEEHVKDDYQKLHAKMIATALEEYAKRLGKNKNLWYITGLLHDLDYYEYPNEHPNKELEWYKKWEYPEEFIHAVSAHAPGSTGVKAESKLAKVLVAADELSGLIYAYSLMRPEGFNGMKPKSVIKKLKDKTFAKKIDRNEVNTALEMLEEDKSEFIAFLIRVYSKMEELKK